MIKSIKLIQSITKTDARNINLWINRKEVGVTNIKRK